MTPQVPTIADYMSRDLVTFPPDLEINKAVARMLGRRISGAPVVDETWQLLGILTAKDCFRPVLSASYHGELGGLVGDYMTTNVVTMDAGVGLVAAAERFLTTPYRRFPVLENGRLVGVISRCDLLRAFYAQR